MSQDNYRFQVNLGGMIEILSDHLYSSPDVYIRELLQNGADAITAKRKWATSDIVVGDGSAKAGADASTADGCTEKVQDVTIKRKQSSENDGCIVLEIEEGKKLTFTDNGLGLTESEIHQFLAIIGESSKRQLADGELRSDYIGRFGIGLLSCFMVSNEIRMLTRSCKSGDAPCWNGWESRTAPIAFVFWRLKRPGLRVCRSVARR